MRDDVLRRMDSYGSAAPLRALISGLDDDVDVVVKHGVGDWLPLAAGADHKAGIYMNRQYLHLLLSPHDARYLSAAAGCRLVRLNKTTGYVRVNADSTDSVLATVAPYVTAALVRSLGTTAPQPEPVRPAEDSSVEAEETAPGPLSADFDEPASRTSQSQNCARLA